jgi:hypothetical protein
MNVTIPVLWYFVGDGLPHVYSIRISPPNIDGSQVARHGSIVAKVLPAP